MSKQHQVLEVSASATPKEVVSAIITSATQRPVDRNPNKWFHLAFAFVFIFGVVVYFREELWAVTKDVQKHPILSYVENMQVHKYLGSNWIFGSGKDVAVPEEMQAGVDPSATTGAANVSLPSQPAQQALILAANATKTVAAAARRLI